MSERKEKARRSTHLLGKAIVSAAAAGAGLACAAPAANAFSGPGTPCDPEYTAPGTSCVHGTFHNAYNTVQGYDYSYAGVCEGLFKSLAGAGGPYSCTATHYTHSFVSQVCGTCVENGYNYDTDVHNHYSGSYINDYLYIAGPS